MAGKEFDVANQLNRGAAPLVDHDEKVKVAAIDLRAGRKAKASAAYAAANHRAHVIEGRVGRYLWCCHCNASNKGRAFNVKV